ncbi:MAG: SDR family NAD(P)-dependent oxidoreductase [Polyangiaceae bacterium]|nr:SDR family NAD(P)-dependent oxidoreductase [Polyangiaceae bacterium]
MFKGTDHQLAGRAVLVTGAARGIGAALARRLFERGARVGLVGIEEPLLAEQARLAGGAPFRSCDVTQRDQVDAAVAEIAKELGGLDVVVANAGVAAQLPIVGGNPEIFERTMAVNVLGTYYTLRAAGAHIGHARGYALSVSSLAAAVHLPLMGAYCASKAAVEALGNSLRIELQHTGARVGTAYFAEIDTDMTERGFGTKAASRIGRFGPFTKVAPLERAIEALEKGIATRARTIAAPGFVLPLLPFRFVAQRFVDAVIRRDIADALAIAREERVELTTPQPGRRA